MSNSKLYGKIKRFPKKIDKYLLFSFFSRIKDVINTFTYNHSFGRKTGEITYVTNYFPNKDNTLTKLSEKYGSDKGGNKKIHSWEPHNYTDVYHKIFAGKTFSIKKVFECGIGTNNPKLVSNMGINGVPGASLRMWRDYFPTAQIYGADVDKDILFNEERIKTFYVDQTDKQSISAMWQSIGEKDFDIIIDDGLHTFDAGVCLFENSINYLSDNGIYIIEDVREVDITLFSTYLANLNYDAEIIDIYHPVNRNDNKLILISKSL